MKHKSESLILGKLLKKIAPRFGASVLIEPVWGIAGQITFAGGKRSYFRYNTLDLNPVGASDIAKDKDYANFFMQKMGYPTIPKSKTFFRRDWADAIGATNRGISEAYAYAQKIGLPVVVKPNSGSQGTGVAVVATKQEFYQAVRTIFKNDRIVLVQKFVAGNDYRLVVLDNKVISAYKRLPLSVIGNGALTIKSLLEKKERQFIRAKRDTRIDYDDPRMHAKLRRQKLSLNSIPAVGEQVFLLDNANLSTGGDAVDVTQDVHPAFRKLAVALTRDMGLRLCGVDLMVAGDIVDEPGKYWILEINAAPGLDHYARTGAAQAQIVEDLYCKVLKSIDR